MPHIQSLFGLAFRGSNAHPGLVLPWFLRSYKTELLFRCGKLLWCLANTEIVGSKPNIYLICGIRMLYKFGKRDMSVWDR